MIDNLEDLFGVGESDVKLIEFHMTRDYWKGAGWLKEHSGNSAIEWSKLDILSNNKNYLAYSEKDKKLKYYDGKENYYECNFVDGKLNGLCIIYYPKHELLDANFENDVPVGDAIFHSYCRGKIQLKFSQKGEIVYCYPKME